MKNYTYTRQFELTQSQVDALKYIIENKYIEFRNARYNVEEEQLESDCYVLEMQGLIDHDDMSWHTTFLPNQLGTEIYNNFLKDEHEKVN